MGTIHDLPRHKGLPVPWVALWSDEVPDLKRVNATEAFGPVGGAMLYKVELNGVERDEHGVLWQPDGLSKTGEPIFGQVNTHRAKACMFHKRCQVCGSKIKSDRLNLLLVDVEAQMVEHLTPEKATTTTPPVCNDCLVASERYCPALRAGHRLATVADMVPLAVYGEVYTLGQQRGFPMDVPFGHAALPAMLGKQVVCGFTDFRWED